jgi:hypothetical protein
VEDGNQKSGFGQSTNLADRPGVAEEIPRQGKADIHVSGWGKKKPTRLGVGF